MKNKQTIEKTLSYVHQLFLNEGSGHDFWHIFRVWNTAKKIAELEKANMFVVELSALLHDVADRKFNDGDTEKGMGKVRDFLNMLRLDSTTIDQVCEIVATCSYAKSFGEKGKRKKMSTLEGMIVQDADRLDALGAIGIARTFAYGGHKGIPLYDPDIKPKVHSSTKEYINNESHTINHFYEKLLLLKDLMNTKTAKKIALKRHKYLISFLKTFYKEWSGDQ